MALPRAVVEAEKRAEEALAALKGIQQQPAQEAAPEAPNPPEEPPAEAQPEPDAQFEQEAAATESQPAEPPPPARDEEKTWEQRYKTLNGKYNAEVPRLLAGNKELTTKLNALSAEIEALKNAPKKESLVKPEEIQEYGEPMVDLVRRLAREEVAAKDAEIIALRSRLESFEATNARTSEESFYVRLGELVPDWVAINDNEGFHAWLGEYDELTGMRRQDILSDAEGKRDANRVARFFKTWRDSQTKRAATTTRKLESQLTPDAAKTSSKPPGKKIWTRGEIAEFYGRARRGELSSADMVAIEADIHAATIENRVRP